MAYFIRRYQKGVKNSGTTDIVVSEVEIPMDTFINLSHATGPGKYILGQRGKGIRGFRKITDCLVEDSEPVVTDWHVNSDVVFNAEESISVKRNLKLSDMSDRELVDLMNSMESAEISSDAEFSKFRKDLSNINREIRRRMVSGGTMEAEAAFESEAPKGPIASAAYGVSPVMAGSIGAVLGGLAAAIGTAVYYRSKIDALSTQIDGVSQKLQEAEIAIKRAETIATKNAEQHERKNNNSFNANQFFDARLLSEFQNKNRPEGSRN
jgi:hypothetical protein